MLLSVASMHRGYKLEDQLAYLVGDELLNVTLKLLLIGLVCWYCYKTTHRIWLEILLAFVKILKVLDYA